MNAFVYTRAVPATSPSDPLPAHWFQILLALASGDLHGLAITKEVLDRTGGRMNLWPGMLYGALRQMADLGYVAETRAPAGFEAAGGRPRFYRITASGRRTCAAEAERMAGFVRTAVARRLIKRPRTT
jgi:DNA-binding PadR family transcriptional regulator